MAKFVFIGLSLSSSWGNGHATTYRALLKALAARGHDLVFLERDVPWYAQHRDLKQAPYCRLALYESLRELDLRHRSTVQDADAVVVGSYVPDGIAVGDWALSTAQGRTAFYDIDTPETFAALERGNCEYLSRDQIARYDLYLTFTGGEAIDRLLDMGSPKAAPLYCSVDPAVHAPVRTPRRWQLGYLGTYSADRQPSLEQLLLAPALALPKATFAVAGAQYPEETVWPANVQHIAHLPPDVHAAFYSAQRYTLNLTRQAMRRIGYSPSVRLFEAAACGTPILSDDWPGLDTFFKRGEEILIVSDSAEVEAILRDRDAAKRDAIAAAARRRVLSNHTAAHRAAELEFLLTGSEKRQSDPLFAANA